MSLNLPPLKFLTRMAFQVPCVRSCLLKNGRVFTARRYRTKNDVDFINVDTVGLCKRSLITRVNGKDSLKQFLPLSGFLNVESWYDQICKFHAEKDYIYLVVKEIPTVSTYRIMDKE